MEIEFTRPSPVVWRIDENDKVAIQKWKESNVVENDGSYDEYTCAKEVFEDFFCNSGWAIWPSGSKMHKCLGTSIDNMLLTKGHEESEDGDVIETGIVYWCEDHLGTNFIEPLLKNGMCKFDRIRLDLLVFVEDVFVGKLDGLVKQYAS